MKAKPVDVAVSLQQLAGFIRQHGDLIRQRGFDPEALAAPYEAGGGGVSEAKAAQEDLKSALRQATLTVMPGPARATTSSAAASTSCRAFSATARRWPDNSPPCASASPIKPADGAAALAAPVGGGYDPSSRRSRQCPRSTTRWPATGRYCFEIW